jgi:hypothetical protein
VPKETVAARVTRHDREIAAIRKLVWQGMKLVAANQKAIKDLRISQRETDRMIKALTAEQRALIRSLGRGASNGHTKGPVE